MSSWKPVNLAYDVVEPSTGLDEKLAPIILLHGFAQTKDDWEYIDQLLANTTHHTVYKLDARNHGDSEISNEFTYEILAEDVNHFMKLHKIPKAILIGHSMGGKTAIEFAGKYPEKTEKLIVEDLTPFRSKNETSDSVRTLLDAKCRSLKMLPKDIDLATGKKWIREFILNGIGSFLGKTESECSRLFHNIESDLGKNEKGFYWKTNYLVINNKNVLTKLIGKEFEKSFSGKALFICGTESPFAVMDEKDRILKQLPNALFKEIANASHFVHSECPEEFIEICAEFIQSF